MIGRKKLGRVAVSVAVPALVVGAIGVPAAAQDEEMGPVAVCELAYYTGAFSDLGPSLTNDIVVPAENVINLDPPLGRPWVTFHEDLVGSTEEAQAYRRCVDNHEAEVVVSIAHGYRTYRDQFLESVEENDGPVSPSVHGGSIPFNLGGDPAEPIFRAQGSDEQLGHGSVLTAASFGAEDVVIFATETEGFQLASQGAERALPTMDVALLDRLNVPPGQTSYATSGQTVANLDPDAVIVQADPVAAAIFINNALEAGYDGHFIGETGMVQAEFLNTLGTEAIAQAESIGYAAFAPNTSTPAWDAYSTMWTEGNANPEWENLFDQYHFSTYDILIQTALAAELAGSYKASEWAPALREVVSAPGTVCYTYPECLALIRDGQDIDYNGVTGDGDFTDGGFNQVNTAYIPFNDDGTLGDPQFFDNADVLALVPFLTPAECDDSNFCEW